MININTKLIPTTLFTPTEYSFIGLTEEEAKKSFKEINLNVYHSKFPIYDDILYNKIDYKTMQNFKRKAYMKVITEKNSGKVLGVHYYGPNSGEII